MSEKESRCKCGENKWKITRRSCCDDCKENDITEDYNQVEEDGECSFGPAWGAGCSVFTCLKCGEQQNIAYVDGC